MQKNILNQYLPLPVFFFLPSIYFIIHATEEVPAFGPWATKHFAPLSTGLFATVHIPLILLVFLASYQAAQRQRHGGSVPFSFAPPNLLWFHNPLYLSSSCLFSVACPRQG